ncbi:MAG: HNH endonuclease signature motif containing protein [Brevibacterium aurantiacum]|uniref:HNH endonuclease signature motif containing protein n=1 Tax=Brevibacterium aurantiacum TaxID=273384 RepID=UPI003F916A74
MADELELPARFWAKVDKSGSCWLWTGAINHRGYGRFRWDGDARLAHRVAYLTLVGPLDAGMQVDHICYERRCVNPAHLHAVSQSQNQENRSGARVDSASGVRGVYLDKRTGKWWACAISGKDRRYSGPHVELDDAAEAARQLRNQLHTNNLMDQREAA